MKGRWRLAVRWGAVVAYSGLIFFLSSLSDLHHLDEIGFFDFEGHDKVEHFLAYAVWALIFSSARAATWPARPVTAVGIATVMGILYGASDEFHQRYVPGRTPDLKDLAADACGALVGALAHAAWRRRRSRRSTVDSQQQE
jgi:hypothetical protein